MCYAAMARADLAACLREYDAFLHVYEFERVYFVAPGQRGPDLVSRVTLKRLRRVSLTVSTLSVCKTPPEVSQAGHNRCPINLTREAALAWLAPSGRSSAELFGILGQRQRPYYEHRIAEAA